jgi:hypothetical protein
MKTILEFLKNKIQNYKKKREFKRRMKELQKQDPYIYK